MLESLQLHGQVAEDLCEQNGGLGLGTVSGGPRVDGGDPRV